MEMPFLIGSRRPLTSNHRAIFGTRWDPSRFPRHGEIRVTWPILCELGVIYRYRYHTVQLYDYEDATVVDSEGFHRFRSAE